jgi:acetate kinase
LASDRLRILVVNAGSRSLKLHLVAAGDTVSSDDTSVRVDSLESVEPGRVDAIAHRIVHGGPRFRDPVVIDAQVRQQIMELEELAPLHNPPALAAVEQAEQRFPGVPQVAVFDTGFHATIPPEASTYAVPEHWRDDWGIRRYGFHGLSVQWAAEQVRVPRLVVCHLGGGCSITAVRDGRSVDTTMGFSPLAGVPMATRSGSIDPGALLYLLTTHGLDAAELERALNFESGLKGLGGGSGDMRDLERAVLAGEPAAELALAVFVHRVAGSVAAMAAAAEGLDAVVFTAGIGEGSALVRARVCDRLGFLGVHLDPARNDGAEPDCDIAAPGQATRVHVIRAREELVAARAARGLLATGLLRSPGSRPES